MPTENPKIFISYSWADRDLVWPLAESLSAKGLEVWIDQREIRHGDRITEQVQKALVVCTKEISPCFGGLHFLLCTNLNRRVIADDRSNTR